MLPAKTTSTGIAPSSPPCALPLAAETTALFLDVDGTLIDIAATPETVVVPKDLVALLTELKSTMNGAVAIITGRRLADVDRLLHPLKIAASGVHGREVRTSPDGACICVPALDASAVLELRHLMKAFPGIIVEPKGSGVAVHYRLAPARAREIEDFAKNFIARKNINLVIEHGRKVLEILPPGRTKGTALNTLITVKPFAGRVPVMIGDDIGDIAAFDAAENLGGHSLRVAGEHFTEASAHFSGPTAVRRWLRSMIDTAAQQSAQT